MIQLFPRGPPSIHAPCRISTEMPERIELEKIYTSYKPKKERIISVKGKIGQGVKTDEMDNGFCRDNSSKDEGRFDSDGEVKYTEKLELMQLK